MQRVMVRIAYFAALIIPTLYLAFALYSVEILHGKMNASLVRENVMIIVFCCSLHHQG